MEEEGICSDAGDGNNPADALTPNFPRALEADGEEVNAPQSTCKAQSDHAVMSQVLGPQSASCVSKKDNSFDPNTDLHGTNAECGAYRESLDRLRLPAAPERSQDCSSDLYHQCPSSTHGEMGEQEDVLMLDSKNYKQPGEQLMASSGSSLDYQGEEMQPDADCLCKENNVCVQVREDEMGDFVREPYCDLQEQTDEAACHPSVWTSPYEGGLRLDELHDDVILHIATFLDARVIRHSLSQVCQRFQDMFDNQAYWKSRVFMRCNKPYPPVPVPDMCWADACVAREDSYQVWGDWANNTHHFKYGHNVNGEVDAVHLMKDGQLMISGDRNRFLNLVDLTKWDDSLTDESQEQMEKMLIHTDNSHGGWIWSMASVGDTLITGSWDTRVRIFDVAAGCAPVHTFKCSSAVLSLYAEENEVVASCFKEVIFFDRRSAKQKMIVPHGKPVLSVVGNEQFFITGSEDKTICVLDRRTGKVFTKLKLDTYPLCMSYHNNELWFGDRLGQLYLIDGTDGAFSTVGTYDVSHKDKITGMVTTPGAIFTCSGDKTIKVSEPTRDPGLIASLDVHAKEIAKIDYKNGVLVSAGGDECVGVWLPKDWPTQNSHHLM